MFPQKAALAIALFMPLVALADENYLPKFARSAKPSIAPAPAISSPPAFPVPADSNARVMDNKSCPKPPWPAASLRNEETGNVSVRLTISETGEVREAVVARSSGFPGLDEAALRGIRHCVFKPAGLNGVAVESNTRMDFVWTLQ